MIRCKQCFIDNDLCECMECAFQYCDKYHKPKRSIGTIVTYVIIAISILAMIFGATSCNVEKRATRLIHKGERINPNSLTIECAKRYRGIDSIDTRIEYRQGETITDTILETEIEIVRDTVIIKTIRTITNTVHDTVIKTDFKQLVNTAAVDSCKAHGVKETQRADKAEQSGKMWRNIALIALLAIALFLVIKFVIGKFSIGRG